MVWLLFGEIGALRFWLFVIKSPLPRSHRSSLQILYATVKHQIFARSADNIENLILLYKMASLFPRFERVDTVYKTLNETPFSTAILVPKTLKSVQKTCPLLVHFHGGGLFMGTSLEPRFLSLWFCPQFSTLLLSLLGIQD